ncbi:hypothetical protein CDN99_24510 [Roseateles aquatilis]|uniref:Beta-ketoacyl synthase N-terminal domain-containing protein n=1 Tax=Roseateles aquatilis TaxID=431061 RepID=A0A246IW51_9BURK|nr:hypothetical protein [Roseateles aquatilis]OWQ84455.1 hypothetical protein CDN99_24510 [Roseateles aquatilis]
MSAAQAGPLFVIGCGIVSAVGYNAPSTLAALRAGVSGVRASGWLDPVSGEPLPCGRVSLPQRWGGSRLLAGLLAPAIWECLQASAAPLRLREVPLFIASSAPDRPGRPADLAAALPELLAQSLDDALHPASMVFQEDQIGGLHALLAARQWLAGGADRRAIVAGVDSLLERATLESLAQRRRLLTAMNIDGLHAGEAGAAVLVSLAPGEAGGLAVVGCGEGVERGTIDSTLATRGDGLTDAVGQALRQARLRLDDVAYRVTDLSGEHYKFKEAMIAALRLQEGPRETPLDLWHPIEYLGEIGAAIVPCLLAWAWHALDEGYAPGPTALCHVGSDQGGRGAMIARAVPGGNGSPSLGAQPS